MKVLQGIDLVKISRIQEAVSQKGKRFLDRIFSPEEQAYCRSKRMKFEHYAARLAAKEAFIKALNLDSRKIPSLNKIEVKRKPTGQPYIDLKPALKKTVGLCSKDRVELSLAHEREYAVATVVVIKA